MRLLTIHFGGFWESKGDTCSYEGDITSKAFILDDKMGVDDLKIKIIEQIGRAHV